MDTDFDDVVDLFNCSIKDSCLWLLSKLDISNHTDLPYALPYSNYVMSWDKAIPLNAIVMAQSPYPNAIFSDIASAMSYDESKCREIMKREAPPTVSILANDLKIHTGMKKEDTTAIVKNGWILASEGILLVNSSVFKPYGTASAYDECINQINVLNRMLRETEKYGERTVDIIAYGAGQAMASELTKYFKSDIIKLTKFTSSHPASLAYRMDDFNSPDCHMNSPSTSRALAKHFSNHVAYAHIMAKKSESELKAQRQLDTIRSLGEQLVPLREVSDELFPIMRNLLKALDEDDIENFRMSLQQIIHTGDIFTFRLGTTSAALSQTQAMAGSAGSTIAKPGPSLSTTSPSMASLSQHVGGEFKVASPIAPRRANLRRSRNRSESTDIISASDNTVNVSSPPSILSENTDTGNVNTTQQQPLPKPRPAPFKLRHSSAPTTGTSGDMSSKVESPSSDVQTPKATSTVDDDDSKTISSSGARFRKLTTIPESFRSGNTGKGGEDKGPNPEWTLSKEVIHQLSCVESVVQYHAGDKVDTDEFNEIMEGIQSDISNKTAYNSITQRLADAIRRDISSNPKFDFSKWVIDTKKPSATFDQCKEEFEF